MQIFKVTRNTTFSFKSILLLLGLFMMISFSTQAQIGINSSGDNPDPSAMLDVVSKGKGFLMPRMTKKERNIIENPANGLMIFQTNETPGFYYYTKDNTDCEEDCKGAWNPVIMNGVIVDTQDGLTKIELEGGKEGRIQMYIEGYEALTIDDGTFNLKAGNSVDEGPGDLLNLEEQERFSLFQISQDQGLRLNNSNGTALFSAGSNGLSLNTINSKSPFFSVSSGSISLNNGNSPTALFSANSKGLNLNDGKFPFFSVSSGSLILNRSSGSSLFTVNSSGLNVYSGNDGSSFFQVNTDGLTVKDGDNISLFEVSSSGLTLKDGGDSPLFEVGSSGLTLNREGNPLAIKNVADPIEPQDAATRKWVESNFTSSSLQNDNTTSRSSNLSTTDLQEIKNLTKTWESQKIALEQKIEAQQLQIEKLQKMVHQMIDVQEELVKKSK